MGRVRTILGMVSRGLSSPTPVVTFGSLLGKRIPLLWVLYNQAKV